MTKSDCVAKAEGSYVPREKKKKQEEKGGKSRFMNYDLLKLYCIILGFMFLTSIYFFQLKGSDVQKKHSNLLQRMAQELKMGPQQ